MWRMYAPHKVACVTGCPRNCAESGIKDVGIIGVDLAEMYASGNGGIKTEAAHENAQRHRQLSSR
jgi:nitrite reductase (NADH) large subunit